MTGFGAAERSADGLHVRVELRSVNNRGLKLSTRAPAALDPHLHDLEEGLRAAVQRGTVWLNVTVRREAGAAPSRIVPEVLADYARQLREAAGDDREPPLEALLRLPGVIEQAEEPALGDAEVATVKEAINAATVELTAMREREGRALDDDLRGHMDRLCELAAEVEARVPEAVAEHHTRLRERLRELVEDRTELAPDALAREAAVLADKTDVAEEVARLRSHADQVLETLARGGPLGRRLDFLAQEMGRESNTIGSKSLDPAIARAVIELKLVVERVKEQAANVE